MNDQRHLFTLPEDIHFINCAYMSPLLKTVEEVGVSAIYLKRNPVLIPPVSFFTQTEIIKEKYARLVKAPDFKQVAMINAASYGMATAIKNAPDNKRHKAITIAEEFPSTVYSLRRWCKTHNAKLEMVKPPNYRENRGKIWNERLLDAIDQDTAMVAMSMVHWADGTLFDMEAIGKRCKEMGAMLIVDGTQSVGAYPIDVQKMNIDALVTPAYKWMMGPYGSGCAYYSERFNEGIPLEESWLNRANAKDFSALTNYTDDYMPGAARYNMGEFSSFIHLPMLEKSIDQLLAWTPEFIQSYCRELTIPLMEFLNNNEFAIEHCDYRADHLFGFYLPSFINKHQLVDQLAERKVMVSLRGDAIRVSPHVYNNELDIQALISCLRDQLQ